MGVTCECCRQVAGFCLALAVLLHFSKNAFVFQDAGRHSNGRVIWTVICCSTPVSLDLISVFVGDRGDWLMYLFFLRFWFLMLICVGVVTVIFDYIGIYSWLLFLWQEINPSSARSRDAATVPLSPETWRSMSCRIRVSCAVDFSFANSSGVFSLLCLNQIVFMFLSAGEIPEKKERKRRKIRTEPPKQFPCPGKFLVLLF